jgi:acetylornithine/succinyldiaminopimelate/putrescine aminotransferase
MAGRFGPVFFASFRRHGLRLNLLATAVVLLGFACAVGIATLHTILDENLCENARTRGAAISAAVRAWNHPLLKEIRQIGLFIGFELNTDAITAKSDGKPASIFLAQKLLDAGMMVTPAGPNVVRWLSPLNISEAHADEGLSAFKNVMDAIAAQ